MRNTYETGEIKFKNLNISWNKLYNKQTEDKKSYNEVFRVIIIDDKKTTIDFKFNNSIMEYEISEQLKDKFTYRTVKSIKPKFWAGYDDCKNFKELDNKRIEHLLYSIINCMANDAMIQSRSFKEFCEEYGYHRDSITDLHLYDKAIEQFDKLNTLNINWYDWEYITHEEDKFNQELKDILNK